MLSTHTHTQTQKQATQTHTFVTFIFVSDKFLRGNFHTLLPVNKLVSPDCWAITKLYGYLAVSQPLLPSPPLLLLFLLPLLHVVLEFHSKLNETIQTENWKFKNCGPNLMNFLTHNILTVGERAGEFVCNVFIHIYERAASVRKQSIKYLHTMKVNRVKKFIGGIVLNASVFNFYFWEMKRNAKWNEIKKMPWILSCSFFSCWKRNKSDGLRETGK